MKTKILPDLLAIILFSILSFIVTMILYLIGFKEPNAMIVNFLISLLALIILGFVFRKMILNSITNFIIKVILNYPATHPGSSLGFNKIYKNFGDAKHDIVQDFLKSKSVKLFFQLGKGVIGETNSLLYDHTVSRRQDKDFSLRVLSASKDSPFLTKEKADERGSRHLEWIKSMEDVEKCIRIFKSIDIKVEAKSHSEEFLMKLFIFDDTLYITPFVYEKKNDDNAPVFKFLRCAHPYSENVDSTKKNEVISNSLYFVFNRYYESMWDIRSKL